MAIYTIEYDTIEERLAAIQTAESQWHQMMNDDFDTGSIKSNVLKFEDSPVDIPKSPEQISVEAIQAKAVANANTVTLPEIIEVLQYKGIL